MKNIWIAIMGTALLVSAVSAQTQLTKRGETQQDKQAQQSAAPAGEQKSSLEDISGMYTFLHDGEFVQINLEQGNTVTGFVSRYGDSESDKDSFLDQFFSKASFDGAKLTWTTKPVHDVWYEFSGTVEHSADRKPAQEGYRLLKGTLTEHTTDANKKSSAKSKEVELKSFPQEVDEQ